MPNLLHPNKKTKQARSLPHKIRTTASYPSVFVLQLRRKPATAPQKPLGHMASRSSKKIPFKIWDTFHTSSNVKKLLLALLVLGSFILISEKTVFANNFSLEDYRAKFRSVIENRPSLTTTPPSCQNI